MRSVKIILGLAVFAILIFYTVGLFSSRYLRFMHEDTAYYSQVAHACDAIMQQHPLNFGGSTALSSNMMLLDTLKLSGRDPSLPEIIRALHPDRISVSANQVFINIPPERGGGFGLIWKHGDLETNNWVLQTGADGLIKTVYSERRP
jgi:hypothetical protein